jgi:hypothetical protein
MSRIYIPSKSVNDWQSLLASPEKQWKSGYSAKAAAYSWQEAKGFPEEISALLATSENKNLGASELVLAIPEHKVYFPPIQGHPSQNDVFALGRTTNGKLLSMAVEVKVAESFDTTVEKWIKDPTPGKEARLEYLKSRLGIRDKEIGAIRYQLLHRLVSSIIEAERFNAKHAILVIQSFSLIDEWFDDFSNFISIFDKKVEIGKLVKIGEIKNIKVHAGWAKGNSKYLDS